jgi:putative RecB family exonuclease
MVLSLTPTKLRDFLTCPQMYKLRHVNKTGTDVNRAALSFGRSLHAALDELYRISNDRLINTSIDTYQLLKHHWETDAYADLKESETFFAKGCEALRRYTDTLLTSAGQTLGTEVFLSCVINLKNLRVKLGCKVDRVTLREDGVLEVLDYKTNASGRLPTAESLACDLPNFLYYILARIYYPDYPNVRISQLNVLTLAKVEIEYDQAQVTNNKKKLVEQIRSFASSDFSPSPSEACAWCPAQEFCPLFNREVDFDSI